MATDHFGLKSRKLCGNGRHTICCLRERVCVLGKGEEELIHEEVVSSWFVSLHCYKRRSGMKQRRLTFCKYFCLHRKPSYES